MSRRRVVGAVLAGLVVVAVGAGVAVMSMGDDDSTVAAGASPGRELHRLAWG